ncbi:MAG: cation-translocating P-type ATPase [Gammaproteobacteria bacterium]
MRIHQLEPQDVGARLRSGPGGLSSAEARARLAEYGPNTLESVRPTPVRLLLAHQFTHFFAIVLWFAAALAGWSALRDPGSGMGTLAIAIAGVIAINGLFSFWQEFRAERTAAALRRLLPHTVAVLRDGALCTVPARDLVPGDVIELAAGDQVPADCRLISGEGLRVDASCLTGESVPQPKSALACPAEDGDWSPNLLLAGTNVATGSGRALVYATGVQARFGRLARLTETTQKARSPLAREIARLARIIAVVATLLGAAFFAIGAAVGIDLRDNLMFAIGIIVANVPEGLLPTFTLALAMGAQRMARRNALIRHLPSVETLGSTTVICTDKTGTLTQNRMQVRALLLGGREYGMEAVAADPAHVERYRELFDALRLCHGLRRRADGTWLGDPMEVALLEAGTHACGRVQAAERIGEAPFDAARMRVGTLDRLGTTVRLHVKGAVETVLPLCDRMRADGESLPIHARLRREIEDAQAHLATRGLRVLAVAARAARADLAPEAQESALELLGLVALEDPPRPEVPEAVSRCRQAGIRVIMVTGDHPQTALAIARQVGIVTGSEPALVTGERLRRMRPTELQLALDAPEIVFARLEPEQKLLIVQALQRKGHVVAVTGDGVNDAPALKQADIGIAMGASGTDVAREAADMVLLDDNFASIVAAVEEGRTVYANIRRFLTYILASNVPEVVPYLGFALFAIPLPLTVIQILAIDLGTDMLPALALGADPPRADAMRTPPARRRLLDAALLARAYLWLGVWEAAAAMTAYFALLHRGGWSYGEVLAPGSVLYRQATTVCLGAIVIMQVANVFVCRADRTGFAATGLTTNRLLFAGIALEIALLGAIAWSGWGHAIFGTATPPASAWWPVLPFALALLVAERAPRAR